MKMRNINIHDFNHPLYKEFKGLYACSFPLFEQRTEEQQRTAFDNPSYHLVSDHSNPYKRTYLMEAVIA